jgi:hypothetical protein
VEKRKDELIQRSNNRSGLGLGSGSMLLDALHSSAAEEEECCLSVPNPNPNPNPNPRHVRERCVNRLVPCKNAHLGCRVLVRLLEKHKHEFVDGRRSAQIRTCLYMGGQGVHIHLVG